MRTTPSGAAAPNLATALATAATAVRKSRTAAAGRPILPRRPRPIVRDRYNNKTNNDDNGSNDDVETKSTTPKTITTTGPAPPPPHLNRCLYTPTLYS